MIVSYKELGFHMSRGRTKPYFVLRHATSCVTTHDSYFQLPELPLYCIYPVFYITDYFMNLIFPLHFPDVYARAHSPNARVNIIMCMPFLYSSCIREKYVL